MPSRIHRDRLINQIKYAVREAENAAGIEHPGLLGRIRELSASHVFGPLLPLGFEIGTGKICDREGSLSSETDLVIYNKGILPPVMYSEREGVFPVESCFYAIEVKSKATASEVRDAIQKGKEIIKLVCAKPASPGKPRNVSLVAPTLFAFGSDLPGSRMSELQRYAKYDPEWKNDPFLKAICVVGKGYWYHSPEDSCWFFHPPTPAYDEVIDLVSGIVNTLVKALAQGRHALLGEYLMLERPVVLVRE